MLQFSGLILFKLRFIKGLLVCVSDNKIISNLLFSNIFIIFKLTTIDCESKIINKQLKLFIYMFF